MKGGDYMSTVIDKIIANSPDGLVRTSEVEALGGHRGDIQKYIKNNVIYKVGRGIYQIAGAWEDELYTLHLKYPKGIVSHETALYIHGFTDRTPSVYTMTFPQGYNAASLKNENVIIKRVIPKIYNLGLAEGQSFNGNPIVLYDLERTVCDILRGNSTDVQIVKDAMKRYARYDGKNINKLFSYAQKLHVKKKVLQYMEVLL